MDIFYTNLGWLGTGLYVLAHFLLSIWARFEDNWYYPLNFLAAALIVFSAYYFDLHQTIWLNASWMVISLGKIINFKSPVRSKITYNYPFRERFLYIALVIYVLGVFVFYYNHPILDGLGWLSVIIYLVSYFLFSAAVIDRVSYFFLAFFASAFLAPLMLFEQNWALFTLQVSWAIISMQGYYRCFRE